MRTNTQGTRRAGHGRWLAPLVLALGLFGCDDFLATEPKAQLTTSNFFTNATQAEQATNATYAMLRNWTTHTLFWVGMTDVVSDDATKGSTPTDAGYLIPMEDLGWDAGNTVFSNTWTGYYQGIYRANIAIQNIPQIDMDADHRARLVAENKFLRAYYYFFLVRSYGGVPLITTPLAPNEYYQQRATEAAVWAQIEQDLTDAAADLPWPSEYSSADRGRATAGAAHGLLAQVHLYQGEYGPALAQAEAVIESGEYSLYPDYFELFREEGENSSETVFEIQTIAIEGGGTGPGGGGSQFAQVQGVRGQPNVGWGFNTPSPDLESSYEPGDPRLQATILYAWETLPAGPPAVVRLNPTMLNNRYNEKVQVPLDNPGGPGNAGVNIRRIRYADVLLIAAEAAYREGDEAMARTYLNEVRERARDGRDVTLGFTPEEMSDSVIVDVLGLTTSSRVAARYVNPTTDAYAAGLRGIASQRDNTITPIPARFDNIDVITAVEGTPVTDLASYYAEVDSYAPGTVVTLSITRVAHDGTSHSASTLTVDVPAEALLPDVTAGGTALLDAIWAERRHELGMEQHRWFDLRRQGRAEQVMEALTCEDRALPADCPSITYDARYDLFPIPLGEVTIAELTQNPGY